MGTVTTLPRGRAFRAVDLETMPDDGHRYEIVDGSLLVTPAPGYRHQGVVGLLHIALHSACPRELRVRLAPFDVLLDDDTVVQPDLLVAPRGDFTSSGLPVAPLLAVEVLSSSTRLIDLGLKKARYEQAGVPSYWVVDPAVPRLTAWDLRDGRYVEVADVCAQQTWTSTMPYAVTIAPSQLLD